MLEEEITRKIYEHYKRQKPEYPDLNNFYQLMRVGLLALLDKRYQRAIDTFHEALYMVRDPLSQAELLFLISLAYTKLGEVDKALKSLLEGLNYIRGSYVAAVTFEAKEHSLKKELVQEFGFFNRIYGLLEATMDLTISVISDMQHEIVSITLLLLSFLWSFTYCYPAEVEKRIEILHGVRYRLKRIYEIMLFNRCPYCGAIMPGDAIYCGICGRKIRKG